MKSNRLIYILIILLAIWCLLLSTKSIDKNDTDNKEVINEYNVTGFSTDLTKVVDDVKTSIVSINANGFISTGFVYKQVDDVIYVLTSYHGIAGANNIYIQFASGFNVYASVVGHNIYADIAILSVKSPFEIKTLNLTDSSLLKTGEFVISIGTPLSLEFNQTAELGMISNELRTIENSIKVDDEDINYYMDVIQLSSTLHPGYSGSPIINMNSEVVGMTTMSPVNGLNFAIPSNEIKIIADKIISNVATKKYQLGIKGSYISKMPSFVKSNLNIPVDIINGMYIEKLKENSVATTAGIKTGDILLSINGVVINDADDYLSIVYSDVSSFEFEVYKDGKTHEYKVEIND